MLIRHLPVSDYSQWVSVAAYGQGEKFSLKPTTDMKLGTSGLWVGIRTGASVTATLMYSLFGHGSMDIAGSIFNTSVVVTPTAVWVPTQWPLVPSFTSVGG